MLLDDHEVALFFPFYFGVENPGSQLQLFFNSMQQRCAKQVGGDSAGLWRNTPSHGHAPVGAVWQQRDYKVAPELFPHTGKLLNNKLPLIRTTNNIHATDNMLQAYGLSPEGKVLVTAGENSRVGSGLCVELSQKAQQRLSDKVRDDSVTAAIDSLSTSSVKIFIKDIELLFFGTGAGVVLIRIQYGDKNQGIDSTMLQEANYATTRIGSRSMLLQWAVCREAGDHNGFGWQQLIESLLPGIAGLYQESLFDYDAMRHGKLYAYTTVIADQPSGNDYSALKTLTRHLARQNSLDYSLPDDCIDLPCCQPFTNVMHCAASEGACTLLAKPDGKSDFFRNFIKDNYQTSYLPIALLAFQEYLTVLRMSQGMITEIAGEKDHKIINRLRRYQFMQLSFRLNYRFDSVSQYSQHNQVHSMFRSAFRIEQLLADVADDNSEAHAYVESLLASKAERRQQVWSVLGLMLGSIFAITELTGVSLLAALKGAGLTDYYATWGLENILPLKYLMAGLYAVAAVVTLTIIGWVLGRNYKMGK